jgi:predicted ATPase/DNA-binding CsgD family transcriptional regulator
MIRSSSPVGEALSGRELEILGALAEGLSNQEIADKLYIALKTVKWYNTQIFSKLGVTNRQEAVEQAQRLSLRNGSHAVEAIPNNLPPQTTPFVGRKRELAELHALLSDPHVRLITILGPGGMGKTRLSLQLAEQQLARFADGVFVARLATLDGAGSALDAISQLFELHHYGSGQDGQIECVVHYLRSKSMLLVLDNFEHLLDDASTIADILQDAPGIKVLVTSRERLNVQGEQVYVLKGMGLVEGDQAPSADNDALRLFVQVVQRTRAGFQVTESDRAHVARICQLVGGMPLAVELAAGWMDILTAERIADEIAACIDILETEMRDVPERHRSIRATFDQTWTRLSEDERHVLMWVSVFRCGFTQEAAEAVAGANLRTLRHLTNKALLYRSQDGRYDLHELTRQYSEKKLQEAGEYEEAIERFITHFAALLEGQSSASYDLNDHDAILKIIADTENIVAVWKHALDMKRFDVLAKIRLVVRDLLTIEGNTFEQYALFSRAADAVKAVLASEPQWAILHAALRASIAYISLGILPYDEARQLAEEAVDLLLPFGPTEELSEAYLTLAWEPFDAATIIGEQRLASARLATEVAEKVGSTFHQIRALFTLAEYYLDMKDGRTAWLYASQLWTLAPPDGDGPSAAWALRLMARLLTHDGKYDEAALYLIRLIDQLVDFKWVYYESDVRRALSDIYLLQGELTKAKAQHSAVIRLHQAHARDWQMLGALFGSFARRFLMEIGEFQYATEILSFVHYHPIAPRKYVVHTARILDEVRGKLDPDAYAAAIERGKRMKLAQVVEDALAYLST